MTLNQLDSDKNNKIGGEVKMTIRYQIYIKPGSSKFIYSHIPISLGIVKGKCNHMQCGGSLEAQLVFGEVIAVCLLCGREQ